MTNLTSITLRLGGPEAAPLPPSGTTPTVRYAPAGAPVIVGGVACTPEAAPIAVDGLPESGDIIVGGPVAAAMAALGVRHAGAVISPGRVVQAAGEVPAYAPAPTLHVGVSTLA